MKTEDYRPLIPIGAENAATYSELSLWWGVSERHVRSILHELSCTMPPDGYVIIRSSRGKGFYRTKDIPQINRYRKEIINRANNTLIPAYVIEDYLDNMLHREM